MLDVPSFYEEVISEIFEAGEAMTEIFAETLQLLVGTIKEKC